jgi:hypothetical protein
MASSQWINGVYSKFMNLPGRQFSNYIKSGPKSQSLPGPLHDSNVDPMEAEKFLTHVWGVINNGSQR